MYEYKLERKHCATEFAVDKFNGKWRMRIICLLEIKERLRYGEIKALVDGITDNMLAITMKDLTKSGLVEKIVSKGRQPKVEYTLTEKSKKLVPILRSMCKWAAEFYMEEMETGCVGCPYRQLLREKRGE